MRSYVEKNDKESLLKYFPLIPVDTVLDPFNKFRAINIAIENDNIEMVKFLIYNGADFTLVDNYENTPLIHAIDKPKILQIFLKEKDTIRRGMLEIPWDF